MIIIMLGCTSVHAQQTLSVSGTVVDHDSGEPIEQAIVYLSDNTRMAMTDRNGHFTLAGLKSKDASLRVECLGYEKKLLTVDASTAHQVKIDLREAGLQLQNVTVTATRKTEDNTTSYLIDRAALDNQQILNLSDIATLLPGGKSVNSSLMNDTRLSLHSGEAEKGNASFGTAIEMDGVRLQNNAAMGETQSASTRNIASTDIESVEIVTGIPSVEYGDLSNGIVKVKTRRGRTPWNISLAVNQYTRQIGASKGFGLSNGVLNTSIEHTRSFSDQTSPHTSYQRNTLSLNYRQTAHLASSPLYFNVGLNGNYGGYNSEADPDAFSGAYRKQRDYTLGVHADMNWQLSRSWLNSVQLIGSFTYSDRKSTSNTNTSSSTAQPYLHGREQGYFIATDYDTDPPAPVIMGPTGYWYVKSYRDSKPISYSLKFKADHVVRFGTNGENRLLAGAELMGSKNEGRGVYYDDLRLAPSWREYRYDDLPAMNNWAFYAEDRVRIPLTQNGGMLRLTAGLREDLTVIDNSDYGTVSSLSPRFNAKWTAFSNAPGFVNGLSFYGGWGKAVKLPSFEVLYPSPSYTDRLAFAPATTADGRAFYAYNIVPSKALYNPDLKWQSTRQWEVGGELRTSIADISVSAFFTKTLDPYIATTVFQPYSYLFTGQQALDGLAIPFDNRTYGIDRNTGIVTITDSRTGNSIRLDGLQRHTYNQNVQYTNGSPIYRSGIDYSIDFKPIRSINTSFKLDGNYYHYHGVEHSLIASLPESSQQSSDGQPYQYIGYYDGSNVYGTGTAAYATASNGSLSNQANLNLTITTHIPKVRLIIAMRLESSLFDYRRSLSEGLSGETRGVVLDDAGDYFGTPYNGSVRDHYVAVYPEYYSTWDNPSERIPFAEKFLWARDNDQQLYNDLAHLVVKTNYSYLFNPDRISAYFSANLNVTKEIGRHVSVSFLANNFLNSLQKVKHSRTGLRTTIYNTGYITPFYYGLSVRIKI